MHAIEYAGRYYEHLYNLSGGTLEVEPRGKVLWGASLFHVAVTFRYDGKFFQTSYRLPAALVEREFPWGHPDHPLVYHLAVTIRDILKKLKAQGVEHALLESWS